MSSEVQEVQGYLGKHGEIMVKNGAAFSVFILSVHLNFSAFKFVHC